MTCYIFKLNQLNDNFRNWLKYIYDQCGMSHTQIDSVDSDVYN